MEKFCIIELNCNSLENIYSCIVVLCGLAQGGIIVIWLENAYSLRKVFMKNIVQRNPHLLLGKDLQYVNKYIDS